MQENEMNDGFQEFKAQFQLDDEFHIEKYWKLIKSKLHILIFITLITLAVAFVKISSRVPIYQASGLLMIDRQKNVIDFDRFAVNDWRNEYFNTQIRILRSRSLMKSVINEAASLLGSPPQGGFTVVPIESTRLVSVRYRSPDPESTAVMVNTLFKKYIEFNLDVNTQSSKQASNYITRQLSTVQKNLALKETELARYGKRKELFYLSNKQNSTVVQKFFDVNKAYTQAQIDRINKQAAYQELKNMSFAEYPQVKRNSLINNLKNNYSSFEGDYKKKAQIFKDDYPAMTQLKSQMDTLQQQIQEETKDIAVKTFKEAKGEYQSALKREESIKKMLDQQKGVMSDSNADAIYYNSLDIEVKNLRRLLDFLTKKQKESLVSSRLEGLESSTIKVIDPAITPRAAMSSGKSKSMIMALFLGIFLGSALIFMVDYLDRTIRNPDDIKPLLKVPALGIIPSSASLNGGSSYSYRYGYGKGRSKKQSQLQKSIELVNFLDPECPLSENYRSIRTSILLSTPKQSPGTITVTSALPAEGKTATVANLAVSFSQLGKKVLVIDGDMRKPRLHKIFKIKNTSGLSTFLVGKAEVTDIIQKTHVPNLFVISSGPIPPNPVELIDSDVMQQLMVALREMVDFIFIDTPPLIGIVDAIILGRYADGLILVTWGGKTHRNDVLKAKEEIDRYNIRTLGVVLNRIDFKRQGYGYNYYGKYKDQYRYKEADDAETMR